MGSRFSYTEDMHTKTDPGHSASLQPGDEGIDIVELKTEGHVFRLHIDEETVEILMEDRTSTGG